MMTLGTFCSGIGAPEQAGMGKPLWFCEIDPFPSAVLAHRFPGVPNLGDMTAPDLLERIAEIGLPDIIVAGLPCQPFSVAGLRKGLEDPRNLTVRFVELADAIDDLRRAAGQRPVWWCVENVPGLLSDGDNAFGALLGGLVGDDTAIDRPAAGWTNAGVAAGPRRVAAWRVLDAQHFGVAQRRRRVFVLALGGAGAWACADALLPIADSLSGHPAPSREAGAGTAVGALAGTSPGGGWRVGGDEAVAGQLVAGTMPAAGGTERKHGHGWGQQEWESGYCIPVAFSCKDHGADAGETAPTPRAMGHSGSHANAGGQIAVAFDTTQITSKGNYSNPRAGDTGHPLAAGAHPPAIAFQCQGTNVGAVDVPMLRSGNGHITGGAPAIAFHARQDPDSGPVTHPLDTDGYSIGVTDASMAVRRLTPTECERLQGFPDGWTDILYRGKPAADGNRYRALGNSMAVPVMRWIGERIQLVDTLLQEHRIQQDRAEEVGRQSTQANDERGHAA